jgi:hypothetical protein
MNVAMSSALPMGSKSFILISSYKFGKGVARHDVWGRGAQAGPTEQRGA